MKTLLVVSTISISLALAGYGMSRPTKKVTQTVKVPVVTTVTKTVATPAPIYHVGDTQDGVTLVAVYHTSYQNTRAANPTIQVVAFSVSGVNEDDINQFSAIQTEKGFMTPNASIMTVPECKTSCVVFADIPITKFYYKNLVWTL